MKGILEIRKLFWLTNSILLSILFYIVFSFVSGNGAGKSTFANPVPLKEKVEIISCKNPLPPGNHRIIVERNIFGSSGSSPAKENSQREKSGKVLLSSALVGSLRPDQIHRFGNRQSNSCGRLAGVAWLMLNTSWIPGMDAFV